MRLLFVSHSLPLPDQPTSNVGGMQRMSLEMRDALERHPEVELTSLVLESSWRWTGVRTAPFLLRSLSAIPRLVSERRIEAVLFSSVVTASVSPLLRRRMGPATPVLAATPVGRDVTLPRAVYQRLVPRILRSLDLVLPISRATAEECVARGAARAATRVVRIGIDVDRYPARQDRAADRAALLDSLGGPPVPGESLILCSVGRHQERKGFHWFVQHVLPRLPADVVYLLAGTGPMTAAIHQAVATRGLEDRVRLLGRVSEEMLERLYRGADLFVMPNIPVPGDIEGFGVVMLEAGLCALPTLAADLEGIRDVIEPGKNGVLLPAGDAEAFAREILRLRDDRSRIEQIAADACRYTAATFAWPAVADQYVQALRSVAVAPRRAAQPRRSRSLLSS